jgi:uncharacterized protein YbcV (DUF1398 family)
MDAQISKVIRQVWQEVNSSAGLPFPTTVERLSSVGVQRYHIDYIASTATAYISHEADISEIPKHYDLAETPTWDAAKLKAAIKKTQAGESNYITFSKEAIEAGVTNYFVYMGGKRVVYMGAFGDAHTEWFPGAAPAVQPNDDK